MEPLVDNMVTTVKNVQSQVQKLESKSNVSKTMINLQDMNNSFDSAVSIEENDISTKIRTSIPTTTFNNSVKKD